MKPLVRFWETNLTRVARTGLSGSRPEVVLFWEGESSWVTRLLSLADRRGVLVNGQRTAIDPVKTGDPSTGVGEVCAWFVQYVTF